jgi:mannose-6-phosphate isomerase-like protein (cupin superfamily)
MPSTISRSSRRSKRWTSSSSSTPSRSPWYNQTLIQVGDVLVRLGVMQGGEFHWHKHDEQDEFFYLLQGEFHIELQDHDTVVLRPHQAFSVPAGMLHRPLVPVRSAVIMIEKAGIVATGD